MKTKPRASTRRTIWLKCLAALILFAALPLIERAHAQKVRLYPDPGYGQMGVYASGPDTYFDYHLAKMKLGDTFPNKKQFWADLKVDEDRCESSHRHDIYFIYCGERSESLQIVKSRVDAWLKAEPDIPTYPELIPAICIGEENIPSRNAVLDGSAQHIRETYGIPVFQFYSMPLSPDPDLTADGWVFDAYGMQNVEFRKHLMKYVALGKPVVCIPWASDPHWTGWSKSSDTAAMINREWHQFQTCMEFDVSCAVFAVAGPGAMNPWLGSQTKHMVKLRNWLGTKREEMHAFQENDLPLRSANFSARDRSVPVGGDPEAPSIYEEDFSGFGWVRDADIRGFLNLELTSRPGDPGFLLLRTGGVRRGSHDPAGTSDRRSPQPQRTGDLRSGRVRGQETRAQPSGKVQASLTYRFESYFLIESVRVVLDASAPNASRSRNEIALSTGELGQSWPLSAVQSDADSIQPLVLSDDEQLKGRHVFYLRLSMENGVASTEPTANPSHAGLRANQLDRLRVECVHQPPPTGATAKLVADAYGNLSYEDDFSTTRWRHLGSVTARHENHGGYREGKFWVGMVGGYATATEIVQRVSSSRELKELAVTADCYADGKNLGGSAMLRVAPRGAAPKWQVSTKGRHRGPLRLEVPSEEFDGLQEFDVSILLKSNSGVEHGEKACATVDRLSVHAR
ncbi:MAG: hypothetical protein H8E44_44855 [Planctomycetes bacterium]|nr:hypothetical protein [Planctomycetota bacterium]MBL7037230.1 hypothetical protein [Pirellulaceae bacterium]